MTSSSHCQELIMSVLLSGWNCKDLWPG